MKQLTTYEEFQVWFKAICPLDEHGFQVRQDQYWLPETPEQELKRLEANQALYREYMRNQSKFPVEVKDEREAEFFRVRKLREIAEN